MTDLAASLPYGEGITVGTDPERLSITISDWWASDERAWRLLARPLAKALSRLAKSPHNPGVSYRNYNVLTAVLMRPVLEAVVDVDDPDPVVDPSSVTVLVGANCSPYRGAQRRCAERQTALRAGWLGLRPFATVTGTLPQADDITGITSRTGLLLPCDDCRFELPNVFGWPSEVLMRFFHLKDPDIREDATLGEILGRYGDLDAKLGRKAERRASAMAV
jgi:hypothetical protein